MSDLTLVGDELRLDGETVAVLSPNLRASQRAELVDRFGRRSAAGYREFISERDLWDRNERDARELRQSAQVT